MGSLHEKWCGRPARHGTGILPVPIHGRDGRTTTRGQNVHFRAGRMPALQRARRPHHRRAASSGRQVVRP